jgi:hypothetical protein
MEYYKPAWKRGKGNKTEENNGKRRSGTTGRNMYTYRTQKVPPATKVTNLSLLTLEFNY